MKKVRKLTAKEVKQFDYESVIRIKPELDKHNKWIRSMKKALIISILMLSLCGCNLMNATPDNPLGFHDPNVGAAYFQAGVQAAQTGQTIGVATGNPAIVAVSTLVLIVMGAVGGVYLKERK